MLKHNTWNRHCGDISCATIIQYWVSRLWQCYSHIEGYNFIYCQEEKHKNYAEGQVLFTSHLPDGQAAFFLKIYNILIFKEVN